MKSIAQHVHQPFTALSSLARPADGPDWIQLPGDDTGGVFTDPTANGTWHWVPQHHDGLRNRMALIAGWIAHTNPQVVMVDVSVEVATLCRLLGVPTVVLAMRGDRSDRPHVAAYDSAQTLIAPWTEEFGYSHWPQEWQEKTVHVGPISRFAHLAVPPKNVHGGAPRVLVLWGTGGVDSLPAGQFTADRLAAARAAAVGWTWRVAGGAAGDRVSEDDIWPLLKWADVVVTHAGQNAVAEVAASGRPAIVIADARPHSEQHDTARTLDRANVAIGLDRWPPAKRWPSLLEEALGRGGDEWARWRRPDGARRVAEILCATTAAVKPAETTGAA